MTMYETYSQRQKRLKQQSPDVFTYDELNRKLRVQLARIWSESLESIYSGEDVPYAIERSFHRRVTTELGTFTLSPRDNEDLASIIDYFLIAELEEALDIIEMMFDGLSVLDNAPIRRDEAGRIVTAAINEANRRFLQYSVGYALSNDERPQLIRKDSEYLHNEIIIPALNLLSEQGFDGANEEYRMAHEHYRHDRQKECLNECLKAFESTMKTICSRRNWQFQPTDTAKTLIDICLQNGLLPTFMQSHLGTVRSALESSIPTLRNKLGGHGQGETPTKVPSFYAEYLLHETAATIVFLVDAFKSLP